MKTYNVTPDVAIPVFIIIGIVLFLVLAAITSPKPSQQPNYIEVPTSIIQHCFNVQFEENIEDVKIPIKLLEHCTKRD